MKKPPPLGYKFLAVYIAGVALNRHWLSAAEASSVYRMASPADADSDVPGTSMLVTGVLMVLARLNSVCISLLGSRFIHHDKGFIVWTG